MRSIRVARKKSKHPAQEGEAAHRGGVTGSTIYAGVCDTGIQDEAGPVRVIIQSCRQDMSSSSADTGTGGGVGHDEGEQGLRTGGGGGAEKWLEVAGGGGWGGANEMHVRTLEEALVKAGHGCRVMLESGPQVCHMCCTAQGVSHVRRDAVISVACMYVYLPKALHKNVRSLVVSCVCV